VAFLDATIVNIAFPAPVGSSTPAAAAPQKRQAHPCLAAAGWVNLLSEGRTSRPALSR